VPEVEIPSAAVTVFAGATLFTVMFALGLALEVADLRWAVARPGLVARALFSVFVAVPVVAVVVAHLLDLPLSAQVGIALMAISPGAPVALRRSIIAGSQASFAAALQMLVAALAIVSMPVSIAALNVIYGTHASISPAHVAQQVVVSQLLPLGLGLLARRVAPRRAVRSEAIVGQVSALMLVAVVLMVLLTLWHAVLLTAEGTGLAAVIITLLALAIGHALGAPAGDTRSAVALSSAMRNAGLALLVATSNNAPPDVRAAVLAYLLWTAVTVTPYVVWRRRAGQA